MITYVSLPKSKKATKFAFLKPLKKKINNLRNSSYLPIILLVGVLVIVSLISVLAAFLSRGEIPFFGGDPKISSLSTSETIPSGVVEIKGHNFGNLKRTHTTLPGSVVFTGKKEESSSPEGVGAMVISWTNDKITVYTPSEAKTGLIYIVNRQDKDKLRFSNGQPLTIKKPEPKISSLSTPSSQPSDTLQIKGESFGNFMSSAKNFPSGRPSGFPGTIILEADGESFNVDVLSWSSNLIEIYTPNVAKKGDLEVNIQVGEEVVTSNKVTLQISAPEPKISQLEKADGLPTEQISISGENLGKTLTNPLGLLKYPGHVFFGNTEAMIESWSPKVITAYIPTAAKLGSQDVKVVLDYLKEGVGTGGLAFTLNSPEPKLESTPSSAFPSEQITLTGSSFGDQITSNRYGVIFPGRVFFSPGDSEVPVRISNNAPILNWSNNSIIVNVPIGATGGKIFVARSTGSHDFYSKGVAFTPKTPTPQIDNLSSYNAQPGDLIEMYGTGFGNQMGTQKTAISYPGKVMVNGKNALPVLDGWHDNQISFYLPWGVKSGSLKVELQIGGKFVSSNEKKIEISYQKPKIDHVSLINSEKNQLSLRGEDFGNEVGNPYVGSFKPGRVYLSMEEKAKGSNLKVLGASLVEAKIESWQNDKITFLLPKNKRTGYLYVTLVGSDGSVISNGISYPKN